MGKFVDLTGQKFGKLTAISFYRKNKRSYWTCKCECGNIKDVRQDSLRSGRTTSCGCVWDNNKYKTLDISNQKFGMLTPIYFNGIGKDRYSNWHCKCDCGKEIDASAQTLLNGHKKSCGCLISDGENILKDIFDQLQINYYSQYVFKDCKNPKTNYFLKYDFFLPDYNCCIEYDGAQHFKAVDYFGGKKALEDLQFRDSIKNEYCKNNNIKLIRIPYWDFEKLNNNYIQRKLSE